MIEERIKAWESIKDAQFFAAKHDIEFKELKFEYPSKIKCGYKNAIAMIFDGKYPQGFISLTSILRHARQCSFVLFTDLPLDNPSISLAFKTAALNKNIEFTVANIEMFGLKDFQGSDPAIRRDLGKVIWYRLLLPWVLDAEKILYLDADILALKDFCRIFVYDMLDNFYAAAKDYTCGVDYYHNAGVILQNAEKIAKALSYSDMVNIIRFYQEKIVFQFKDQDVLNFVFRNELATLPWIYNAFSLTDWKIRFLEDATLIHFAGDSYYTYDDSNKDKWHSPRQTQLKHLWENAINQWLIMKETLDCVELKDVIYNLEFYRESLWIL